MDNEALARRRFYAAQMNLADQAFESGQITRVLDLLETPRPVSGASDLRGFEWFHLWREIHRALHTSFRQSAGEVWCLAFFPGGRRLAVASVGSIRLWEVEVGQELLTLNTPESKVRFLTVTSDGANLISRHDDGVVRIWKSRARGSVE